MHGKINSAGVTSTSCSYAATCTDKGYTCDTSTGLCGTQTCTSESGCNTLMTRYNNASSAICKSGAITFACPATSGSDIHTLEHGNVANISSTDSSCTYQFTCSTGYQLQGNSTATCNGTSGCTKSWLNGQIDAHSCASSTIKCPSVPTVTNGTVNTDHTSNQCKYTLDCDDGYTEQGTPLTYTCNSSSTCTSQNVNNWARGLSCESNAPTFTCPTKSDIASMLPNHVVISEPTPLSGNKCKYTLSCSSNSYTLNPSSPNTVTCTSSQCTAAGVAALVEGTYTCQSFTCPGRNDFQLRDHMTLTGPTTNTTTQTCSYTLGCATGYEFANGQTSDTLSCSGSHCTSSQHVQSLIDQHECKSFTCPDPHDLQKPATMTITMPTLDSSTQTCTYDLGCISGYAIPIAPPHGINPQRISCTGDECSNTEHLQELLDHRQNYKLSRCGKVWSVEECSATYAEGSNAAGTVRTYWNALDYNGTMCILTGQCDVLHECNPGSLSNDYCDGLQGCGAGMGSEGVTEDCSELVQNFQSVSCSNDCPSVAKVEQFVLEKINYANSLVSTDHWGDRCVYKIECESGAIMDLSCSKTNGCKLDSSDWVYPPCSYY